MEDRDEPSREHKIQRSKVVRRPEPFPKMFVEGGFGGVARTLKKDAGENASGVERRATEKT